jgi:threonine dehydrogenase-like Zn-dependent dehydrogenase
VYPRAIRLVESGQIAVDGIISDRFHLHQIELAMKTAAARTGHKVVLHP